MQYLIVLTIIGWGIGSLFYKIANDNMHPVMVSTIVTCLFVVVTPLAFLFIKFDTKVNTTGVIFALLGGACMCSASLCYFFSLRGGHAGVVTAVTSLYPALTLILSMVFLHEQLNPKQWVGFALSLVAFALLGMKS